ncbi:MAG: hypothetical protein IPF78_11450 [Flavobacteriales bacterium]|nr:hypothetical protein [Flavobacteriales bacterium]
MKRSSIGNGTQIMSTITPTASEAGTIHTINYTAQTNDPVPLTSTYTVYLKVLDATTGIHDASRATNLTVQPNPAMDRATITWPTGQQPGRVEVFAMNGAVVMTKNPIVGAAQWNWTYAACRTASTPCGPQARHPHPRCGL